MNQTTDQPPADADVITPVGRRFIVLWSAFLVALFVVAGIVLASGQHRHKVASIEQQAAQVDPQAVEPGLTSADAALPAGARPVEVTTGIYVERIIAVSVKDFEWKVE